MLVIAILERPLYSDHGPFVLPKPRPVGARKGYCNPTLAIVSMLRPLNSHSAKWNPPTATIMLPRPL